MRKVRLWNSSRLPSARTNLSYYYSASISFQSSSLGSFASSCSSLFHSLLLCWRLRRLSSLSWSPLRAGHAASSQSRCANGGSPAVLVLRSLPPLLPAACCLLFLRVALSRSLAHFPRVVAPRPEPHVGPTFFRGYSCRLVTHFGLYAPLL